MDCPPQHQCRNCQEIYDLTPATAVLHTYNKAPIFNWIESRCSQGHTERYFVRAMPEIIDTLREFGCGEDDEDDAPEYLISQYEEIYEVKMIQAAEWLPPRQEGKIGFLGYLLSGVNTADDFDREFQNDI